MVDMAKIGSLCKRRGFIFQSSEIYGGVASCWDFGPLGVLMKNNLKQLWWKAMVSREDIEGLDASILMHSKVWEASGHVAGFTDPLVDCKKCKQRFRADNVTGTKCAECGGELTAPRMFNLMFKTFMGPVESEANVVYLRPETAQGIYVNFINVQTALRKKIPFGIAQIGKAFRNEITPGNFIFRTREFEQMEMQFFVKAGTDGEWMEKWKEQRMQWHQSIGIRRENLRFHQHEPHALAHYAKEAYDIEYQFPFGWQEMEGIHNRTDYDLSAHQKYSGKNLTYFDEAAKERFIPYIIETSAGCDRILLAVLIDAYEEDAKAERVVLHLHHQLAPIKVAFFPLVNDEKLLTLARKIYEEFRTVYTCQYDTAGSIGRRYRRQDEIGTPFGLTVDFDSLTDHKVTVRDRDTMQQKRVEINQLSEYFRGRL